MQQATATTETLNVHEKQAQRDSKTQGAQYVVWVFDEGRRVFDREQARRYAPFVQIECLYVDGIRIGAEMANRLVTL